MVATAFWLIIGAVGLEVIGQIAFKRGASGVMHANGHEGVLRYWGRMLLDPWIQAGIVAHVVEVILWVAALNLAPLSLAFPLVSLSYCGVAIAGHFLLGERIGARGAVAVVLVSAGAAMVAWPTA